MGVAIHYRGSLGDLDRVEDFEDRALDLALELGGQARIWRSTNDDDPRRTVRGVVLNLYPGQETTSLLISPEGWLIGLCEIEAAEQGQLAGPPWCCVKTQFGPIEGHVALVEMLAALKRDFLPDLEVRDEGDYWQTRDLAGLTAIITHVQAAIEGLAEGLHRYGLSREAVEDQEILLTRIERIAQLVQRTLGRPAEHPPVSWSDEETAFGAGNAGDESQWDASYKENRRRQEHVYRAIEEHLAQGDDVEEAFDAAMHEETALGLPDESPPEVFDDCDERDEYLEADDGEPWKESLSEAVCDALDGDCPNSRGNQDVEFPLDGDAALDGDCPNYRGSQDVEFPLDGDAAKMGLSPSRHPLQQRAFDFMLRLQKLLTPLPAGTASHQDALLRGAGDMLGGLAQAIGADDSQPLLGLAVVQLKRALRGAAFALGALFPLRTSGTLDQAAFDELYDTLQALHTEMYAELNRLRQRPAGDF